jgi:hypothetical protein
LVDAGIGESLDLGHGGRQVHRAGERHRLDGDRRAATDGDVSDHYPAGVLAVRGIGIYRVLHR